MSSQKRGKNNKSLIFKEFCCAEKGRHRSVSRSAVKLLGQLVGCAVEGNGDGVAAVFEAAGSNACDRSASSV